MFSKEKSSQVEDSLKHITTLATEDVLKTNMPQDLSFRCIAVHQKQYPYLMEFISKQTKITEDVLKTKQISY
jgi:hypothetical protein